MTWCAASMTSVSGSAMAETLPGCSCHRGARPPGRRRSLAVASLVSQFLDWFTKFALRQGMPGAKPPLNCWPRLTTHLIAIVYERDAETEARPCGRPSSFRLTVARPLLRFGNLLARHLALDGIAIGDGLTAARVGGRQIRARKIEPHVRGDIVLRHTVADGVEERELVLRLRVVLFGGEAVPLDGFSMVLRHAFALGVHEPEDQLGARIALLGQRPRQLQRSRIPALVIGRIGRARIREREAKHVRRSRHRLPDRLLVDAEHEAQCQTDRGDDDNRRDPHGGPMANHRLALSERLPQGADLLLEGLRFRSFSALCKAKPWRQRHERRPGWKTAQLQTTPAEARHAPPTTTNVPDVCATALI